MAPNQGFGSITSDKKAYLLIKFKSGDKKLSCHFNPEKYTINREIGWKPQPVIGNNVPASNFEGGGPSKVTLTLLFDTTFEGGESTVVDVRDYTKPLWDATRIDQDNKNTTTNKGTPPTVVFMWGRAWTFEAVINSLSQEFILFSEEGVPIRSTVTLGLTQIKDDTAFGRQNPTSGGTPGKIYTVREGDRLDLIAASYYKKPMLWRYIAEHNDIDNPRDLMPGQRLIIPELP